MYDLSQHTEQELFDVVVKGLAKQEWQQAVIGSGCVYNTPKGLHCAAGQILAAFGIEIKETHNYSSWTVLISDSYVSDHHRRFIYRMQLEHDQHESGASMRDAFFVFAEQNNLTWPEGVE